MAKTRVVSQDIGDASVLPADLDVTADNTTADATTGHHGLLPKLGGGSSNYLRADGTWAAPSGSGAPASVDYLVGTADGGLSAEIVVGTTPGGELGGTWASPTVDRQHAGSAHPFPIPVQTKINAANTQNPATTLDITPTAGNRIVMGVGLNARPVTSVSQTNVTWTKMSDHNFSTTMYGEIWVGVVSASPSATVTVNTGSSNFVTVNLVEVTDALTPTLDQNAEASNTSMDTIANTYTGAISPAAGTFFAAIVTENNGTINQMLESNAPMVMVNHRDGTCSFGIGYAPGGEIAAWTPLGTSGGDGVSIICSIT